MNLIMSYHGKQGFLSDRVPLKEQIPNSGTFTFQLYEVPHMYGKPPRIMKGILQGMMPPASAFKYVEKFPFSLQSHEL